MTEIEGQISLFDLMGPQEQPPVDITEEYLKEAIMHGTGFTNGKKRVYEFYQKRHDSL